MSEFDDKDNEGEKKRGAEPEQEELGEEGQEREDRLRWFFASRVDAKGKFRSGLIAKGSKSRRRLEAQLRRKRQGEAPPPAPPGGPGTVNWTPIGPSVVGRGQATGNPPVSGRINGIAVGPGGSRVYTGAANGGLWYSANGGSSWVPLDDYATSPTFTSGLEEDSLSVGAIAVRFGSGMTSANDDVWVGTGEPGPSDGYFGVGIKHSPSGGAPGTWSLEATNLASKEIYKLVIDPDNPALVYAATTEGIFKRPAAAPFTTWTQVISSAFASSSGAVTDLIVTGSGGTKKFYAAFSSDKVYTSTNGSTWTALTGIPAFAGRIALAAGETGGTVYAFTQNGTLLRLVGTAFQTVSGVPSASIVGTQGWYDLVVAVDPSNDNTVYLAGAAINDGIDWNQPLFKGTITGGPGTYGFPFNPANASNPTADPTWMGTGVHADAHSFAFALNGAGTAHDSTNVWIGTDGGPFQSTSSGAAGTFRARNTGLAITEMTFFAQRPDTDAVVFAGCQDNGTLRYWGEEAWFESPEGDGGGVAVDGNDQYRVMRQYVQTSLYTATDGGASGAWSKLTSFPPVTIAAGPTFVETARAGFYGPIASSPAGGPTLAAYGTNRLWLTTDWGTTWTTLPTNTNPYGGPSALTQDVLDDAFPTQVPNYATGAGLPLSPVTAIAFPTGTRIYAATPNQVWRFDLSGTWSITPITTTGLPSGRFITDLAVENAATGTFYAALGGAGFNHLWYFDGSAWHAAGPTTGTLDVPCHAVTVDPASATTIYLGSDVGCWAGTKTGTTTWSWLPFSQGLPECALTDLEVHALTRLLRAATHGRGIWEIQLGATSGLDPDLYVRVDYADTGRLPGGSRYPWVENHQDPSRKGFQAYHWMSPDIKVRRGSLPAVHALNSPPDYLDFAVNIDDYVDSLDEETADISGTNKIFVQVHNRGLTTVPGAQVRVLLLLTDAYIGLPSLPADYATHINAGDTSNWVAGSAWKFADPVTPYRTLPADLDVRTPGVVEFDADFTTIFGAIPSGHTHFCAAAFVTTTTTADPITGTTPSMDTLTMTDKHACHRNLHLVTAGSRPVPPAGEGRAQPETFVVRFHNATEEDQLVDLVFRREMFPGHLSVMLPKLDRDGDRYLVLEGFDVVERNKLEVELGDHLGRWLGAAGELIEQVGERIEQVSRKLRGQAPVRDDLELRVAEVAGLDHTTVYVAGVPPEATIGRVPLRAGQTMAAAVTIQPPEGARPGDRFHFDVIQGLGKDIVGGSTYVVLVTERD